METRHFEPVKKFEISCMATVICGKSARWKIKKKQLIFAT